MLTKDEYLNAMDSHVKAAMDMAKHGMIGEASKMVGGLIPLAWELTRPGATYESRDVSYAIPDEYRDRIATLEIVLITDEDGKAMIMWGQGKNADGNDLMSAEEALTTAEYDHMMGVIDELLNEQWPDVDRSQVTSMDEVRSRVTPATTTHIAVTEEAIDKAVDEFSDEFDRLFETWGGGDSSG